MRYIFGVFAMLLMSPAHSQVDVYQWCQAQINMIKDYSALPARQLISRKISIAKAATIEELTIATGKDLMTMVPLIQNHQNISEAEARKIAVATFKPIEIRRINEAIEMHGVTDELEWNKQFDECVSQNRGSL